MEEAKKETKKKSVKEIKKINFQTLIEENLLEKLNKEYLNELGYELDTNDDRYLRLVAEYDNYRKRTTREQQTIVNNTRVNTLSSILELDNDISIAIKNESNEDTIKSLTMIYNKLAVFFKTQNIEEIQTENYDPDLHDVITVLESNEDKIIDVISKGYKIDGKPFKYPKIILGKKTN